MAAIMDSDQAQHYIKEKIDQLRDIFVVRNADNIFVVSHIEGENDDNNYDGDTPKICIQGFLFTGLSRISYYVTNVYVRNSVFSEFIFRDYRQLSDYLSAIADGNALEPQEELSIRSSAYILENLNNGNYNHIIQKFYPDL